MQNPQPSWLKKFVRTRRILRPRPPESLPASTSRTGESARALTDAFPRFPSPIPSGRGARLEGALNSQPSTLHPLEWPLEYCATEPNPFLPLSPGKLAAEKRRPQNASHPYLAASNSLPFPFAAGFVLILLFLALPALSAVREVAGVGLTVNDLNREV